MSSAFNYMFIIKFIIKFQLMFQLNITVCTYRF